MGAERNHLAPVISYSLPPMGTAWVVLERTSVPPCRSVMLMPMVTEAFSQNGTKRPS